METKLMVFRDKGIRRVLYQGEWHFSIIDVVEVLSGSSRRHIVDNCLPRWSHLNR